MSSGNVPDRLLVRLQRSAQHRLGMLSSKGEPRPPDNPIAFAGTSWDLDPLFENHRVGRSLSSDPWQIGTSQLPAAPAKA